MTEAKRQFWLVIQTATSEGSDDSGSVGFYNQLLEVPVLMVFTEHSNAVRYATSELGAAHGPAVLEVEPLPVENFKNFARRRPECFLAFDVTPDTPMPSSTDELTPIQEFAATL